MLTADDAHMIGISPCYQAPFQSPDTHIPTYIMHLARLNCFMGWLDSP